MKEDKKNQTGYDKSPWSLFSSVKLAVALLILIALASIAGTLLPQQEKAVAFISELSPTAQKIWSFLGLSNMYHSWWFRILLAALAFNLTSCTLDRLPSTMRIFRARLKPDMENPFEGLPEDRTIYTDSSTARSVQAVSDILSRRYRRTAHKEAGGIHFFAAEKGRFSLFGVHMVHASILFILAGALVGSFIGFQAYVNIPEGSAVDTIYLRSTRAPLPLGFTVRCDTFHVEFYETGAPKEYRSELIFLSEGSEPEARTLRVNHPAVFNGVTFYQSSYGTMPGGLVRLRVTRLDQPGPGVVLEAVPGDDVALPGDEGHFRIVDMHSRFMNEGAAVLVSVRRREGPETQFWVFENPGAVRARLPGPMAMSRKFDPSAAAPFAFEFVNMTRRYYTGLQANKDPGVPLVWAGCTLMIAGFMVTFFYSHRRMRVRLAPGRHRSSISVAGWSNRNPVGLEQEIDVVLAEIAARVPGGGNKTSAKSSRRHREVPE